MQFNGRIVNLQRYPKSSNRSLRAWSAADELMLSEGQKIGLENKDIVLINDSFGALTAALLDFKPHSVINNQSQLKATRINLENAGVDISEFKYSNPLKLSVDEVDLAMIKIPKSADLFQLYIQQLYLKCKDDSVILCGFMTRNFTTRWKEIAEQYFEEVSQSLAVKKARLLILKSPRKEVEMAPFFQAVKNDLGLNLKQYAGVFSAAKVDPATQLLLENLPEVGESSQVLDLACGNGVIAAYIRSRSSDCALTVLDDSYLAISSAKLNLGKENAAYSWSDSVKASSSKKFDFVFCNPPFHFEYENTIEISLRLFEQTAQVLSSTGKFYLVANTHLNYRSHLSRIFTQARQVVQSGKYEVICCEGIL